MSLVSIIIPNYNRACLIGETLDSIINQTYKNWECIIVDDGSTDESATVIQKYVDTDKRIKLFLRPDLYPKGANACRNIGIDKAEGDYVIFFDSDDLMKSNHIEVKLSTILKSNYDFIVARSEFLDYKNNKQLMNYRDLSSLPITVDNFTTKKINWITFDPIIKFSTVKQLRFTEKKQSAEEYNFFVKLLILTEKAIAIEDVLTLRRYHEDSYQVNLNNSDKIAENQFHYFFDTYLETKDLSISKISSSYLLNRSIEVYYKNKKHLRNNRKGLYYEIIKNHGLVKGLNKIRLIESKN